MASLTSFSPLAAALLFFSTRKTFAGQYGCLLSPTQPQEWQAAQSPEPGVRSPEPFCLCSLLFLICGRLRGARAHPPFQGARSSPAFWRSAGPRDASGLASRLRQPATSRQLPPACLPRCWQVPVSKNSSGGDSSLGLEQGDESEEGRQLHSQTRWGWGAVGGEYPVEACPSGS